MRLVYMVVLGGALLLETLGPVYAQQMSASQTNPPSKKAAPSTLTGKQSGQRSASSQSPPKQTVAKARAGKKPPLTKKQVPPSGATKKPVKKVKKAHSAKRLANKASKSTSHKARGPKTLPKKTGHSTPTSGASKNSRSKQERARKEVQRK